jgi:hypothetical protein
MRKKTEFTRVELAITAELSRIKSDMTINGVLWILGLQ